MINVSLIPPLRRWRRSITSLAPVFALGLTAAAFAATSDPASKPKKANPLLWATVNVCDTAAHPDTIGIRGSMPGSGDPDERMYMRFQVQYHTSLDDSWHNIGPSGDTGFIPVGPGKYRARQAGRSFIVKPPPAGSFTLRGAVTYEWRVDGDVVKRARRRTTNGHGNTSGADPRGYSAASCIIKK